MLFNSMSTGSLIITRQSVVIVIWSNRKKNIYTNIAIIIKLFQHESLNESCYCGALIKCDN